MAFQLTLLTSCFFVLLNKVSYSPPPLLSVLPTLSLNKRDKSRVYNPFPVKLNNATNFLAYFHRYTAVLYQQ